MEKKEYNEPELRVHGSLTDVTLDAWDDPTDPMVFDCWGPS